MATKRATYRMKAKVWTPTMTAEVDGSISGVIESAFWHVPGPKTRQRVLASLYEVHLKLMEHEHAEAMALSRMPDPALNAPAPVSASEGPPPPGSV